MKFLCVACDEPMQLESVDSSGGGSLSVLYACPRCSQRTAMLTNPLETEMVQSLGVKIGPRSAGGAVAEAARDPAPRAGESAGGSAAERAAAGGCPFSGVVREMEAAAGAGAPAGAAADASPHPADAPGQANATEGAAPLRPGPAATAGDQPPSPTPTGPVWTADALERLEGIPEFVRPMARQGIEHYARSNGYGEIDERVLDEARTRFGM